jgi:hypothetical protein
VFDSLSVSSFLRSIPWFHPKTGSERTFIRNFVGEDKWGPESEMHVSL